MAKSDVYEVSDLVIFFILTYWHCCCRDLDFKLQDGLKKYLEARGIGETLTNFLIFHLHKKEHNQYVNWLQKLKGLVEEENEWCKEIEA